MYEKNYINSINYGLINSKFRIEKKEIDIEAFFTDLNETLIKVQKSCGRIFFFGNGASASFSNHMALDWSKNGGILAFSLSDSSLFTALANDYSYEDAFVEFMKINSINSNDLVITTSSSGNSKNIVNALNFV